MAPPSKQLIARRNNNEIARNSTVAALLTNSTFTTATYLIDLYNSSNQALPQDINGLANRVYTEANIIFFNGTMAQFGEINFITTRETDNWGITINNRNFRVNTKRANTIQLFIRTILHEMTHMRTWESETEPHWEQFRKWARIIRDTTGINIENNDKEHIYSI
jgi:hypothetical protein